VPWTAPDDGFILIIEHTDSNVGPIGPGNPVEFTMLDLAQKILNSERSDSKLEFKPLPMDDASRDSPTFQLPWKN
jgi:UDP-glucuronate decarboxylase